MYKTLHFTFEDALNNFFSFKVWKIDGYGKCMQTFD